MSTIPNHAMPHAGTITDSPASQASQGSSTGMQTGSTINESQSDFGSDTSQRSAFSQLTDKAREYPKTAIAAGAAVAAGVVTAAVLGTRGRSEKTRSGNSRSGTSRSKSSSKKTRA